MEDNEKILNIEDTEDVTEQPKTKKLSKFKKFKIIFYTINAFLILTLFVTLIVFMFEKEKTRKNFVDCVYVLDYEEKNNYLNYGDKRVLVVTFENLSDKDFSEITIRAGTRNLYLYNYYDEVPYVYTEEKTISIGGDDPEKGIDENVKTIVFENLTWEDSLYNETNLFVKTDDSEWVEMQMGIWFEPPLKYAKLHVKDMILVIINVILIEVLVFSIYKLLKKLILSYRSHFKPKKEDV